MINSPIIFSVKKEIVMLDIEIMLRDYPKPKPEDETNLGFDKVTKKLYDAMTGIEWDKLEDIKGWMMKVE